MDVGDGAGEAERLDGRKNEGVLMACIAQVLEGGEVGGGCCGGGELETEWRLDGFCVYGIG